MLGRLLAPIAAASLALFACAEEGGDEAPRAQAPPPPKPHVVLVIFDEFPLTSLLNAGNEIDPVRYPNFAALARGATWFRNATSIHDRTTKAVPAILTGYIPRSGQLPLASDHPNNLFTLLGRRGYRLNVSEEATRMCPGRCGRLSAPSREPSAGALERQIVDRVHGGRRRRFVRWLDRIHGDDKRALDFAHLFFPHVPYQYLPSGRLYLRGWRELIGGINTRTPRDDWLVKQFYQRHLLQLANTDRLVGKLVRRLKDQGIYESSVIVLVADHGATFRRNLDRRRTSSVDLEDLASVPLIVKAPGQRTGQIRDRYARTVDVLPTIADLLDMRISWRLHGRSAFDPAVTRRGTVFQYRGPNSTIATARGTRVTMRTARFETRQARALRRKLRLFGEGNAIPGVFGIGPNRSLLGRQLSGLRIGRGTPMRASFGKRRALGSVRRRSGFVPAQVTGKIRGRGSRRKRALALAVNGRVEAVGESFLMSRRRPAYFSLIVPEAVLRDGANRVQLFVVGRGGILRPLGRVG
jgi:hypothetical protein